MITVEGTKIKKKGTPKLNKQEVAIFRLVGMAIADQPEKLKMLLAKYGVDVPEKPKGSELTDATIYSMGENNPKFNHELAMILVSQIIPDNYDSFKGKDLLGGAMSGNPVSSIAGAIGSIFDFAGGLTNRKAKKDQARRESMMSIMMMDDQESQRAANQQALLIQQQMKTTAGVNKMKIIKVVGVIGLVALLGGLYFWKMNKNKLVPQPSIT
jgi:hypothetical protein